MKKRKKKIEKSSSFLKKDVDNVFLKWYYIINKGKQATKKGANKMTNYRNETVDLKDIIWDEACKLFSAKAIIPNREAFEKTANKYYVTIDDEDWNNILERWTENMTWDELKKFLKKMKMTFREYSEKYYGFCDITEEEEEELKKEGF